MSRLPLTCLFVAAVGCSSSDTHTGHQLSHSGSGAGARHSANAGQTAAAGQASRSAGAGHAGESSAPADGGNQTGSDAGGTASDCGSDASAANELDAGPAADGGPDLSSELFDQEQLPRIDIELTSAARSSLASKPGDYVPATVRYGTHTATNVGLRIKGEASLRTLEQKAAFKLKFDELVTGQTFLGLRRLTLNNMVSDASFIAERLAYHMFIAAGLPAPRCNHALVYVDGEYYGVYANVESEDKTFLRRWFTSDQGNLYEDGQVDLAPGNETAFDLETNETANDRSDLTGLIDGIAAAGDESFIDDLAATLDTDHYLHFAALEAVVNQWDGYSYTYFEPNNFRLYHDPSRGKFVFLPWGMDLSMKPFPYTTRTQLPVLEVPRYEDKAGARDAGGLLWKRCIQSAACKQRFAQVLRNVVARYESEELEAVAARYYTQIKDHVYEDTRKEITNQEFEAAYQSVLSIIRARATTIRAELTAAGL